AKPFLVSSFAGGSGGPLGRGRSRPLEPLAGPRRGARPPGEEGISGQERVSAVPEQERYDNGHVENPTQVGGHAAGTWPGDAGPLTGVRVMELGTLLAGPFAGRMLADFGAEVIKVDPPGRGDPLRDWGQNQYQGRTLWWPIQSRNKKL